MSFDWLPKGTQEAASILFSTVDDFVVYFDPDVDGLFSGFFPCKVLDAAGKHYDKIINENRAHGFLLSEEEIAKLSGKTVIAVDFSITQEKLEALKRNKVRLINIDHHSISSDSLITYSFDGVNLDGVVINNQYSFEPEEHRYLSGAGVVFYVLSHIFDGFDTQLTRGLVGLTLLSDIRPLENEYARVFLSACYTCRDPYMLHLVDLVKSGKDYGFGIPLMERNYVDYTFSPKMNALFRLNMGTTAIDLIFGGNPPFNLDDARTAQNQVRDLIVERLVNPFSVNGLLETAPQSEIEMQPSITKTTGIDPDTGALVEQDVITPVPELTNLRIKYVEDFKVSDTYKLSNFIGLTCSQIKAYGKSTVLYVGTASKITRGSFRGLYDKINYLDLFMKYGFNCAGHENAFGILECNLADINFVGLNTDMRILEAKAALIEYENRIHDVSNLDVFCHTDLLKQIAMSNIYVRDHCRVYLRYTGKNVTRIPRGKMWEFSIDGIKVKCFDADLDTSTGYILPIYDRRALTFYLKNIKKS